MVSRSHTMATRSIGGFSERDTCLETEAIRMSLCTLRATRAAAGGGYGDCTPGSCATLHRRIFDDRT